MAARGADRRGPTHAAAPIITLTTDFGTRDPFVGIMKGVMLAIAPLARIVDLTHEVPAQNVVAGAHALASATPWFPPGTIHVAVVDPGVGTRRRALAVEAGGAYFVGPDNGVLSLAAPRAAIRRIVDVSRSRRRLRPVSSTFHGRDVFAPIAAALASGVALDDLGPAVRTMHRVRVPRPRRKGKQLVGTVLWRDGFGNLTTNVTATDLDTAGFRRRRLSITIAGHVVPFRPSYASVSAGRTVALMNSSNLLEVAVNRGSAAALLDAGPGARVTIEVA
jgi:S-adenosyl-L-methionine hydrolase (adenosine-forming)